MHYSNLMAGQKLFYRVPKDQHLHVFLTHLKGVSYEQKSLIVTILDIEGQIKNLYGSHLARRYNRS